MLQNAFINIVYSNTTDIITTKVQRFIIMFTSQHLTCITCEEWKKKHYHSRNDHHKCQESWENNILHANWCQNSNSPLITSKLTYKGNTKTVSFSRNNQQDATL